MTQPVVVANDWSTLTPPALGAWEPTMSVTVVVPAHRPRHLPLVLAALAAQSYPDHLLEVVVVDDGSEPAVRLPEVRPENTRLLQVEDGWGRAAACQTGADHSDGDVIHWLDADMVADPREVEAQLRWHHLVDYAVVLGHKTFTPDTALDVYSPNQLLALLRAGKSPEELACGECGPHAWVEEILQSTDDLRTAGPRAMRVHTGASASVGRDLFRSSGGMPVELPLGEDIVLGYRLREAGAVFVPDRESRALHLGETTVMRKQDAVNRYNRPFLMDLVPEFRGRRAHVPRSYAVPYLEIVLPLGRQPDADLARATIDHLLAGQVPDAVLTLVAPWGELTESRRSILDEELLELRLVRAHVASEPRVRLREEPAPRCDATFRLTLPDHRHVPVGRFLPRLLQRMERRQLGGAVLETDHGTAVLTRTAAAERLRRIAAGDGGADLDLTAVYPVVTLPPPTVYLTDVQALPPLRQLRGNPMASPAHGVRRSRRGGRPGSGTR